MMVNGATRVHFGPFEADFQSFELRREGVRLKLSGQPFQVLGMLLERPGELITREELRSRIWKDDTFVDFSHGLNSAVNKLREALGDSAQEPRYVETLPRRGYRFIAPVDVLPRDVAIGKVEVESPQPTPQPDPEPSHPLTLLVPESSPRSWKQLISWKRHIYVVLAASLLFLALAAYVSSRFSSTNEAHALTVPQRVRPLTVLADPTAYPSFSSDGNYAAFYREGKTPENAGIYISQIGTDQIKQLTSSRTECCPVWSPDRRYIAFTRSDEVKNISIYIVPSGIDGETAKPVAKKLDTGSMKAKRGEIDWSPDGEHIAFDGGAGLFLVSVKDSSLRRITETGPLQEDWGPSFSADGKRLLFVRSGQTTVPDEIRIVPVEGGETVLVLSELGKIQGPPQWSSDGQSVIFASLRNGQSTLWKVSADKRDTPVQFNYAGWNPSVSRRALHLAYTRVAHGLNVWTMDLSRLPAQGDRVLISSASQTDQGPGPQYSPDGSKIAFMSDRSGTMEIWIADRDGNNEYQLTAVGDAGTPRWSPDGRSIVFDASGRRVSMIYSISLEGGSPRPLTEDRFGEEAVCPSWSRDGRWIYYSHNHQVWKVQASGGKAIQLTQQGGHAGFESPDGKYLYYAKTYYSNPSIWRVPVDGGAETLVSPQLRPASWASWSVVERGIIFAGSSEDGRPVVNFYDFATHHIKKLASLDVVPFWLSATYDGRSIAFDKQGWMQSQVMLVDNFH
jgi:Tol biopolymer transport system component/DNA-binding winged helix-turn-helix (wHTH) protein